MQKVRAFHVEPLELPIHVPFSISKESLAVARIAVVTAEDESGRRGLGEASPFPSLTFDTIGDATRMARELADECVGLTPTEALTKIGPMREDAFRTSRTGYVGVESALYDLHARQLGVPLRALFGTGRAAGIETDITLPIMPPAAVADFWERFGPYEFRTIKVKVSGNVGADVELVRAMRHCLPESAAVTLDGNQGYTVDGAKRLVAELAHVGIDPLFFEQPLPADDWHGLKALTDAAVIPVCLDETVASAKDALRVAQEGTARIVNLKIMKAGVAETLRIIHIAQTAGIELMIGGMLESEIAMGLSLQIATGTGAIAYADLDTPFFFARHVTAESPWHERRAKLIAPSGVGIGMTR